MLETLDLGSHGLTAGCEVQEGRALGRGGCLVGLHMVGAVSVESREGQGEDRGQDRGLGGGEAKWASAEGLQRS